MPSLLTTDPDLFDLDGWRRHLEMLVTRFPDETELIASARAHIATLEGAEATGRFSAPGGDGGSR